MFDVKALLQQQLETITTKKKAKGVRLSASTGISYNAKLQRLIAEIKKDIDASLVPLIKSLESEYTADRWGETLTEAMQRIKEKWLSRWMANIATNIATEFIAKSNNVNRQRFGQSLASFGLDVVTDSPNLVDFLELAARDNAQLIESIPDKYLSDVESVVLTNVRAGRRASEITQMLQARYKVTKSRAKLIARDQTAKINSNLTKRRQQLAGFKFFQWVDADDERVRHRHEVISNKETEYGKGVYRWDDLPRNKEGMRIAPGEDYQCRCIARPVLPSEVARNQEAMRAK